DSPNPGAIHPTHWWSSSPTARASTVRSRLPDQEVESRATAGFNYYEGAVSVGGSVKGVGYMELTGYTPQTNPFINPFAAFGGR
ncbi:MAG: lipocalin family protein, partial [Pleurocapsa sp. SU_196_0]|nr:lipocalin family protein [Pleurocapsa sp. SU_196_0]